MATEKFTNSASSTLNGGISDVATSLVVTSAASFPVEGQFRVKIESEILLVTGVSGTTFTVTRAQEGTTAVSHSTGLDVVHVLTAGAVAQLKEDTLAELEVVISPASLATNQNDYSPTDWATATHVRLTSSADVTITGVSSVSALSSRYLINVGSNNITLAHNSTSSAVGNRFLLQGSVDLTMVPNDVVTLWKDPTSNAWRVM